MRIYISNNKEYVDDIEYDLGANIFSFIELNNTEVSSQFNKILTILYDKSIRMNNKNLINESKNFATEIKRIHPYFSIVSEFIVDEFDLDFEQRSKEKLTKYLQYFYITIPQVRLATLYLLQTSFNIEQLKDKTWMQRGNLYLNNLFLKHMIQESNILPSITLSVKKDVVIKTIDAKKLIDVININFLYLYENRILFRKCKNCGKFFVLDGASNIQYCERIIPGSKKTCREMGAVLIYQKKAFDNPVAKLYNREYKKRNARIRYGMISKEDFNNWANAARIQRDKCLRQRITLDEFVNWLDNS
ncbi:DUF6076 domain-containing protein [Paludicola sp. MB14-C6]|uniref:DUF6076 domain-containing protein n=1 Tax=Paludihabitans sp. MB14-C6 TaxID=3070656 RepID=UPI0027DBB6E3|nr:DUF6076 domain-containing protein [Paludicola sp. MB14-C6]WMJ22198.1 DUF6076 domain-containing protein [Paludicola sp. MB14-C6]